MQMTERDRKMLRILAPIAAVAVLAFVFALLHHRGKASPTPLTITPGASAPATPAPGSTGANGSKGGTNPPSALVFSGRDPFQALISTVTVNPTPSGPPTPSPAPSESPAASPPPGAGDGSSIIIAGHHVVLDDIFTTGSKIKVQVEVDGAVYTVGVGDTFASSFKLLSVTGSNANFAYGDQTFSLTQPQPSGS